MRKPKPTHLFFVLLTAFLAAPAAFAVDVGHIKGENAYASFSSTDPSGCIQTFVYLEASNVFTQRPLDWMPQPDWSLGTSRVDHCGGYRVLFSAYGSGPLDAGLLNVSPTLSEGTLRGVFQVHDAVNNADLEVSVDLAWIGGDEINRGQFHIVSQGFGQRKVTNHRGVARFGGVVSGTVSFGTGNLTPDPGDGDLVSWMDMYTIH